MQEKKKRKASLLALFFVYFLDYFGYALVFGIFGPLILKSEFGMFSAATPSHSKHLALGVLFAVFPLSQFFGGPIFGDLADRHGRKKMLYLSMLGNTLGYLLSGAAIMLHSFNMLIISRIVTGFFSGNRSICLAAIADLSPEEDSRSENYGIIGTLGGLSWIVSMLVGGYFSDSKISIYFNPALPFWITAFLSVISCTTIYKFFSETHAHEERFSIDPLKGIRNIMTCFRIKRLGTLYAFYLFLMMGWGINLLWLNPYALERFEVSQTQVIWLLVSTGIVWSIGSAVINKMLLKRKKSEEITRIGLYGVLIVFILCGIANIYPIFAVLAMLASAFGALAWTNSLSIISLCSSEEDQGKVMGLSQSVGSISMLVAPLVAGVIAAYKIQFVYPMAAALVFLALIILSVLRVKQKAQV